MADSTDTAGTTDTPAARKRPGWAPEAYEPGRDEARWLPHMLLFAIFAFIALALAWAGFAEIDQVARGDGKVIPSGQNQVIQNLEGGIVSEILVREGDTVEKDQVLFRIDPTRFVSSFREGEQARLALRSKVARLQAETSGGALAIPGEALRGSPAIAAQEKALHETRKRDVTSRDEILRQQLAQRRSELAEMRNREQRLRESFDMASREIAITAPLVKQGVMSELDLLRQEREATRIRTDLDAATLAIPRILAAIEEASQKLRDNELAFRAQAGVELSQSQAEYTKLAETIPALEDRVSRTTVRSPARGIVKTIANKSVGGVIQPGNPMAEIVPLDTTLLVETRISPSDIAFVKPGQRAVVKLSAFDYSIYGGLDAKIVYVSADSILPPQGPGSQEPYYIAHVQTDKATLEYDGRQLQIIPGMTASVDILTGKHSILHYLLKPINKATDRALRER